MTARRMRRVVFAIGVLWLPVLAWGDGSIFGRWSPTADIFQPTQKVYIHCDGQEERLVIQTKYAGPAEEMVWLIPVPARPTVERGDPNLFVDLSKQTHGLDISLTDFVALRMYTAGGARDPVVSHQRIGDYDVVLLAPVGSDDVIDWLGANEFGVPDEAVPILHDYIAEQWWMIAARIHPDALTEITRAALADGTLHPLDIRFPSEECVYPLRLTSLAAGPVQELIYIEGPCHYQPATLTDGDWEIEVFGGTQRSIPEEYAYSAVDQALEMWAGRVTTETDRYLTKLWRVFTPEEMTDDLVFEAMDYTALLASDDPNRIVQAATQLGRQRDPAGVAALLDALSPAALEPVIPALEEYESWLAPSARILSVDTILDGIGSLYATLYRIPLDWHLRSCIWALGEIGIEHPLDPSVETVLLRCAEHDNQLIRMEAYTALIKLEAESLGPLLVERFGAVRDALPVPMVYTAWWDGITVTAEMDMVADWIDRFGTPEQRATYIGILLEMAENLPDEIQGPTIMNGLEAFPWDWPGWVLWRAAWTRDARMLAPLQAFRARLAPESVAKIYAFLLTAEAACGSTEAVPLAAQHLVDQQSQLKVRASGGYVPSLANPNREIDLRQWILWQRTPFSPYDHCHMPSDICDAIARTALEAEDLNDWWVLFLLGHIRTVEAADRARLMDVWDHNTGPLRVATVDLLLVWRDTETLLSLQTQATDPDVQAEIAWALAGDSDDVNRR